MAVAVAELVLMLRKGQNISPIRDRLPIDDSLTVEYSIDRQGRLDGENGEGLMMFTRRSGHGSPSPGLHL